MKIDLQELRKRDKYINCHKHPTEELYIWNYNQSCQFEKAWDEFTLMARGLITDKNGEIIARPFKKFFNLGEIGDDKLPNGDFKVYDKFDGSLGILYWIRSIPYIATRGSFNSEQAIKGTEILRKYGELNLDGTKTYLFEIIYPENRIVVDYGKREDLILLAVIDTETGKEENLYDYCDVFPFVSEIDGINDFRILTSIPKDNAEGFVIKWDNGFRVKMKFDEYVRLHRLITEFSSKSIWELLKNNQPLDELLERVPDEFFNWVKSKKGELESEYNSIFEKSNNILNEIKNIPNRKEQAIEIMKNYKKYSGIIFSLLDNKPIEEKIWRIIKPEYEQPFKTEI